MKSFQRRSAKTQKRRSLSEEVFAPLLLCALMCIASADVQAEAPSFKRDIAPVLLNNCLACHGPKKSEGGYRIDTFERVIAAGDSTQPGFVAKDLEGSEAFRRITSSDPKERMPLEGDPFPAEQVTLFKRWIEAGIAFDGPDPKAPLASYIPPPTHPAPPEAYRATMPITAVDFSPDGSLVLVGGYHELTVWSAIDGKLVHRMPGVGQRSYVIHHSPDGQQLAVGCGTPGKHGEVRLLKAETGELVKVLGMTSDVVFDCAFSPSGDRLATTAADGVVRVFDVVSGSELLTITSHSDWVFCVAWNADGTQLATGSRDKTAKVFDAKTGELLITYNGHNQPVRGVLFHPEGKEMYSAGSDNKLHRWSIADGKKGSEAGLAGEGYKLTPAGELFFASSADNKVRQYNFTEQKPVREFTGAKDWVLSTAYHAATKRVAGGAFDGRVTVWNAEDGSVVTSFVAAPGYVPQKK
jgi:WD40 repeat protein